MMVTGDAYEPEALGEENPEAASLSTAGDDDDPQQQGERYTGRHRIGPDVHPDGPDSAQPRA